MPDTQTATPYVLRAGEGRCHLVAGQMVRTVANVHETAGGFGAMVCDCPLDRFPIPMHWHEREHDTWFCTRGKLQVWCGDQSRVLTPGDFAYVVPGDTHSYRSVAPRTQFFGVVAPGGWEQFFVDAGEVWGMTGLPPENHPYDFRLMGPAIAKHGIMQVKDPVYVDATPIGAGDQVLPAEQASYFLEAGFGVRRTLFGHLSTAMLTAGGSKGVVDMRQIEGGRGSALPTMVHRQTHVLLFMIDGTVALTLDGAEHVISTGDAVNVPAGTSYQTRITSGSARWVLTSANGNAALMWDRAGTEVSAFSFPLEGADDNELERVLALVDVDVALA